MPASQSMIRNLLSTHQLSTADIERLLQQGASYLQWLRSGRKPRLNTLDDVSVTLAFFENSTRTRISFDLAARRLGAEVVVFDAAASSLTKGETIVDTIHTIEAMHSAQILVMRHNISGIHEQVQPNVSARLVNAGDGKNQHPTQALLDVLALLDAGVNFHGLKVVIIGDILHSRVARSNLDLLTKLGAHVAFCGPDHLVPAEFDSQIAAKFSHVDQAVEWADVAIALRIQLERMIEAFIPSTTEFHERFGLKRRHLEEKPRLMVLHPGPINREVEIASEVADAPQSLILRQVECGVALRMAVLSEIASTL